MTLESTGPVALYVQVREGRRLVGHLQRIAIIHALQVAGEAMAALSKAHASATAIVAGEDAAKLFYPDVVIRAPRRRETRFSVENVRRSKGERKRNRKQRWSR